MIIPMSGPFASHLIGAGMGFGMGSVLLAYHATAQWPGMLNDKQYPSGPALDYADSKDFRKACSLTLLATAGWMLVYCNLI